MSEQAPNHKDSPLLPEPSPPSVPPSPNPHNVSLEAPNPTPPSCESSPLSYMPNYPLLDIYDDDQEGSFSTTSVVIALGILARDAQHVYDLHHDTDLTHPLLTYSTATHRMLESIGTGATEFAARGLHNHIFMIRLRDKLIHLHHYIDDLIHKRDDEFSDMDDSESLPRISRPTTPDRPQSPVHIESTPPPPVIDPPTPIPPTQPSTVADQDTLTTTLQLILKRLDTLEQHVNNPTPQQTPTPSNTHIRKQPPTNPLTTPPKQPRTQTTSQHANCPPPDPTPTNEDYDMHLDDDHFPSLPQPTPPPFTTVTKCKKPQSYTQAVASNPNLRQNNQPPPAHPNRPTAEIPKHAIQDKLEWVICFSNRIPGNINKDAPDFALCQRINSGLHKAVQSRDANVAYIKWTLNNNVILSFDNNVTNDYIRTNIVPHIRQEFSLPDHVIISQNIPWA
ncbi:hypothetical protein WOLCODRAFT_151914 [Wolfiporia cocos MD-104 SS10]|uniref:Uncharacterized protein n=1 Tax=Wolfiporia cocos (strain MD-104) TaxID=742152 RepID=A0A2H3JYQ2_WOLCO|nr:hypothetical protein WOLCODRAFT_151914 [Wolfiporia cocos MD-104 SS10]